MTNKNEAIGCTVNNCTHHAQTENYCTLNKIQVGTHGHRQRYDLPDAV